MPYYTKPNAEVHKFVTRVMKKRHQELAKAKVTFGLLAAWQTEKEEERDESPLKFNGYKAAAVVSITAYKLRVLGIPDFTITLDGKLYDDLPERSQEALIDHELFHLYTATDKNGDIKKDDANRPKLKIRQHDIQIGGFSEIIERHGDFALEKQSLDHAVGRIQQLTLPFDAA